MTMTTITYDQLQHNSRRIEDLAARNNAPARVRGTNIREDCILYLLAPNFDAGARVAKLTALARDFAAVLGVPGVTFEQQDKLLALRVPLNTGHIYRLADIAHHQRQPMHAILGVSDDIESVCISRSDVAHVLIAGKSRSGKSTLADTMLISLCNNTPATELRVAYLDYQDANRDDGKSRADWLFSHIGSHLWRAALSKREILPTLRECNAQAHRGNPMSTIVFIDELFETVRNEDTTINDEAVSLVRSLVTTGGKFGVHVIACTQNPNMRPVAGLIAGNFQLRLITSVANATDAYAAAGIRDTNAEQLRRGEFKAVYEGHIVTQFRSALAPNERGTARYSLSPPQYDDEPKPEPTAEEIAKTREELKRFGASVFDAKAILDWTLAERVAALRAWNPDISKRAAIAALAPGGKAGGHYKISEAWGDGEADAADESGETDTDE